MATEVEVGVEGADARPPSGPSRAADDALGGLRSGLRSTPELAVVSLSGLSQGAPGSDNSQGRLSFNVFPAVAAVEVCRVKR